MGAMELGRTGHVLWGGRGVTLRTDALIRTGSLFLRRFVPGDAARVYAMSIEPGMREWLPDQVYADESAALGVLERLTAMYDDPGDPSIAPFVLGVCLASDGTLMGHVGLSPLGGGVEIGFCTAEAFRGAGYATEAVRAMAAWGIGRFGLSCVLGVASSENAASCRVLEKAGFVLFDESPGILHDRPALIRRYRTPSGLKSLTCHS